MDIKLLHVGMKICIDPRSTQTEKTHGFADPMMCMLGTTQKIQKIHSYGIKIGGYDWSPEDLSLPYELKETKPLKKYTPILFNPEELIL